MFNTEKYLNYSKFVELEAKKYKGLGRIVGDLTGGLIGESSAEHAQKKHMKEMERQARAAEEEYRRRAQEEAQRRAEERARYEEEVKKRAEEESKRRAEEESKRRAENHYRDQVSADMQAIQKENINRGTTVGKPQTTVDFSKTFKFGEDEEDKLKKLFKMGR